MAGRSNISQFKFGSAQSLTQNSSFLISTFGFALHSSQSMTSTPPQNHRIGQLDGYPPALPTGTERRASQKAWKLGEIRDAILGYLDKADLAVMMRVDREGMRDVAGKLYRRVEYEVVQKMDLASVCPTQIRNPKSQSEQDFYKKADSVAS